MLYLVNNITINKYTHIVPNKKIVYKQNTIRNKTHKNIILTAVSA